MTFKEAMEHYRAGAATEEERLLVEQELEKSQLIAEYLDKQWEETVPIPAAPAEEMQQVRKSLRKRNARIVLTSLALVVALTLTVIFVGIPAAESLYWDPSRNSFDASHYTDLEPTLAAYAELFCPGINISSITTTKSGFATYDISIQYWNTYRGSNILFADATVEKGHLTLPNGFWDYCAVNIFDRATYPFYPAKEDHLQRVSDKLSQLPEYVTVVAAVSFPEDKSMAEVLAFQDTLLNGSVGWTAIRTAPLESQFLPLCGMDITPYGTLRAEINEYYPCFDIKGADLSAETLETHFLSLLRFSSDQAETTTRIFPGRRDYYTDVLEYVEDNGIYSYGCYVTGTPETILALLESGAVTQVWIEDIWISV